MKSGLWILVAVIVVGIIIGFVLRDRISPPEITDNATRLAMIQEIADSEDKIAQLEAFIAESPEDGWKSRAYSLIAREIVQALKDTARFVDFARQTIESETDAESKAAMYYWLYRANIESHPQEAFEAGRELLDRPIEVSWIYNYIGFDLAEKNLELDLALPLCERAIELAANREDSSSYFDSRGWVYYRMAMYKEAVADIEKAVELSEEPYEEILRHLAYAALRGGESDKAFETFKRILVTGEYDYVSGVLDSLMDARGYSGRDRKIFEKSVWQTRMETAKPAHAFDLSTIDGDSYRYDPTRSGVSVVNFMSPT